MPLCMSNSVGMNATHELGEKALNHTVMEAYELKKAAQANEKHATHKTRRRQAYCMLKNYCGNTDPKRQGAL
jgi:hypothetical protein